VARKQALILGVGNPLFGDDGFGIEVIRRLRDLDLPAEVMDGGTAGIYLLPELEGRDRVLIVDAIRFDAPPGTLLRLEGAQIPKAFGLKLSEHQVTLKETLALLDLIGGTPREVVVLGVQPERLAFAEPLSEAAEKAIPMVIAAIREKVERWRREEPLHEPDECAVSVE
jgi:hydrogenase maturation protease